jgi:IS5 family transposase
VRSERLLMEELEYNLAFRWFVGLGMDDPVWVPTTFTKNRDRLLEGEIAQAFFDAVLAQGREDRLLSDEHFSVDGTLIEAWASHKSFVPKKRPRPNSRKRRRDRNRRDGGGGGPKNPTVDFRGQRRVNDTHASTTDPEARMARIKGEGAKLSYQGHVLIENRNGLVVDTRLTPASGTAEWEAALSMLDAVPGEHRITLGGDKGYDVQAFVEGCRERYVTPHVAQNQSEHRRSRIDERTTRHAGYGLSQRRRKIVEEVFGWMKTVGLMRQTRHRGAGKVGWVFTFTAAAYNLVRLRNLRAAT